jgi:hypothetical protein
MSDATAWDTGAAQHDAASEDLYSKYAGYYGENVSIARHADGGGYLFKTDELIVAAEDVEDVETALDALNQTYERGRLSARLDHIRMTPGSIPACTLVTRLRALERPDHQPPLRVYPNHILFGNNHGIVKGGPGHAAGPAADALAPPPPPRAGVNDKDSVRVAVLDNGDFVKHEWLNGRVEKVRGQGVRATTMDDAPDYGDTLKKYAGHGTFVTGVVLQHAPAAKIVALEILNDRGYTTDVAAANAIRLLPDDIKVVLMSCGGLTHGHLGTPAIEEALGELWAKHPGLPVVTPAGNEGNDCPFFPAAHKQVIAVAAIGNDRAKASFSNFGSWVDACAPGVGVRSTFVEYKGPVEPQERPSVHTAWTADADDEGAGALAPAPDVEFKGWAYWSGTCFAAARVAGAIAQRIADTGESPAEAAFRVVGDGQKRWTDGGYDIGVPVYPQSWA